MTAPLQGNTGSSITASASGEEGWESAPQSIKRPSTMDERQGRGEVLAAFCSPHIALKITWLSLNSCEAERQQSGYIKMTFKSYWDAE